MSIKNNTTSLQEVLAILSTKASATQATPEIFVDANGLITATAGNKSATHQLAFQAAKTITPGTTSQVVVSSGYYTGGDIMVAAIPNEYIVTSDATAEASEIMNGETAYVNGSKVTGTFTIDEELSTQDDLITQITTALEGKAAGGEQAAPEISIDSSSGLITAMAGSKTSTYQLAFQTAKTVTPGTVSQVAISSGHYAGGDITVAGDSNLIAENIKSGVSIFGISGTAETGGETVVDDVSKAIIEGTITEIEDDSITNIGNHAFYYKNIHNVSFPACTNIGEGAFYGCINISAVSFPACISIGNKAFTNCHRLNVVNFPAVRTIGTYAFQACSNISAIDFPSAVEMATYVFSSCRGLKTVNFPAVTSIGNGAFYQCSNLTTTNFPVLTSVSGNTFNGCTKLPTINLPKCINIGGYAFRNCYSLSEVILGASSVCTLQLSNIFSSTPFAGYSAYFSGTPHIYVPSSLITAYQSATNWTYFSSYFSAIESLEE